MLNHFARLVGIINACKAATLALNWSQAELVEEVKMMQRCAELLMRSLASDSLHRDEALRLVLSNPLNFAIACQVVDSYHSECEAWATEYDFEERDEYVVAAQYNSLWQEISIDDVLYAIVTRCYAIADSIETGTSEDHEPSPMETKVSLAASINRGAWGPFHRHQKRPSKPKGSKLSDKRKAVA